MASEAVSQDSVVSIHYTLTGDDKQVIDSSRGHDPLDYLHGHGQIVPGLERALQGKKIGEKFSVEIAPEDGYGNYENDLTRSLNKKSFPKEAPLEVGSMFEFSSPEGTPIVVRITDVQEDTVTVDGNHPLAGKKLFFDVEVVGVRAASKAELEHGHAHGPHGHDH